MNFIIKRFIILTFLILSISAFAYNPIAESRFYPYDGEGDFVELPAYFGSAVGCFITGYPAAVITEPLRLVVPNSPWCDNIGFYIVAGTSKGFGAAFGAIPFLCKKLFYDLPTGDRVAVKEKTITLPQQLVTPPVPEDIGDVKNLASDTADIIQDQAIELKSEKEIKSEAKAEKRKKEKQKAKEEKKEQITKEDNSKPQETTQEDYYYHPEETKKEPVEVSPNLPSWVHEELKN